MNINMARSEMQVEVLRAFENNYIFVLKKDGQALVIDPGDADPVFHTFLSDKSLELAGVLITHHHQDHVGGLPRLLQKWPNLTVVGNADNRLEEVPGQNVPIRNSKFSIGAFEIEAYHTPGHTIGGMSYMVEGQLFVGDTLFGGGCGRVAEGFDPDHYRQLYWSLKRLTCGMPDCTKIWFAHEYTLENLEFAHRVMPDNVAIRERLYLTRKLRKRGYATVPTYIGAEKRTNPFLLVKDSIEFTKLRRLKDEQGKTATQTDPEAT